MGISQFPAASSSITPTPPIPGVPSGLTLRHTITSTTTSISWVGTPTSVYVVLAGGEIGRAHV